MEKLSESDSTKRAVNLSVRADLVDEAESLGTDMADVFERALDEEHRLQRAERWRTENRPAVQAWNEWVEENGIPLAKYRPW